MKVKDWKREINLFMYRDSVRDNLKMVAERIKNKIEWRRISGDEEVDRDGEIVLLLMKRDYRRIVELYILENYCHSHLSYCDLNDLKCLIKETDKFFEEYKEYASELNKKANEIIKDARSRGYEVEHRMYCKVDGLYIHVNWIYENRYKELKEHLRYLISEEVLGGDGE